MIEQEYGIVSGWNGTPVNVEHIVPTGNPRPVTPYGAFYMVRGFDTYARGSRQFDITGGSYFEGYERVEWVCNVADPLAWQYAKNNYEGLVTVNTTTGVPDSYTEYNSICQITDPAEMDSQNAMFLEFKFILYLVETTA